MISVSARASMREVCLDQGRWELLMLPLRESEEHLSSAVAA
jgi:hypothetical protein